MSNTNQKPTAKTSSALSSNELKSRLKGQGLTPMERLLITEVAYHLQVYGKYTVLSSVLAEALDSSERSINNMIARLDKKGWLVRVTFKEISGHSHRTLKMGEKFIKALEAPKTPVTPKVSSMTPDVSVVTPDVSLNNINNKNNKREVIQVDELKLIRECVDALQSDYNFKPCEGKFLVTNYKRIMDEHSMSATEVLSNIVSQLDLARKLNVKKYEMCTLQNYLFDGKYKENPEDYKPIPSVVAGLYDLDLDNVDDHLNGSDTNPQPRPDKRENRRRVTACVMDLKNYDW